LESVAGVAKRCIPGSTLHLQRGPHHLAESDHAKICVHLTIDAELGGEYSLPLQLNGPTPSAKVTGD
jgi:hypothetical protein